ncbi:hypothetical protein [Mesorhizobium sp. M0041]|uniref:hypothetical protein n=1 Tax=Mesorhizobium sp. M0041 TaxID=2956856 RepID=UPI00333D08F8
MRYHPDNQQTVDETRFNEIVEAHNVLKDSVKPAQWASRRGNGPHRLAGKAPAPQCRRSASSHLGH